MEDEDQPDGAELLAKRPLLPVAADGVIWPSWVELDRTMVVGGMSKDQRPMKTTEVFDILSLEWEKGPDMAKKRWGASAIWLDKEKLMVLGGYNGAAYLDSTEIYSVKKNEFYPGPKMRCRRAGAAVVRMSKRHILVVGGYGQDTTEVLLLPPDPVVEKGSLTKAMTKTKAVNAFGGMAGAKPKVEAAPKKGGGKKGKGKGKGKKGKAGEGEEGKDENGAEGGDEKTPEVKKSPELSVTEDAKPKFEEFKGVFLPGPQLRGTRACCSAVMLDNRRLLVMGGFDKLGCAETTEIFDMDIAQRQHDLMQAAMEWSDEPIEDLDLTAGRFTPGPPLAQRRAACAAVRMDQKRVLIVGGFDGQNRLATTEILEIVNMEFIPGPKMSEARSGCSVLLVKEHELLVAGGCDVGERGGDCQKTVEVLEFPEGRKTLDFRPGIPMGTQRGYCSAVPYISPEPESESDGSIDSELLEEHGL